MAKDTGTIQADVDVSITEASLRSLDDYINKFEDGIVKIQKLTARTWQATLEYTDKAGNKINTITKLNKSQALKLSTKQTFASSRSFLLGVEESARERRNKLAQQRRIKKEQEQVKEEERQRKEEEKLQKELDKQQKKEEAERMKALKADQKARMIADKEQAKIEQDELRYARGQQFLGIVSSTMDPFSALKVNLQIKNNELNKLKASFGEIEDESSEDFEKLRTQIIETQKEINKLNEELAKGKKISPFEKLINTFKRVGFYRIARRLFQVVEQGFSQSITAMAKFDDGVNDTMSSIISQFQIMSSSFVVVVYPLLQMIRPVLEGITKGVANFANTISYLIAKLTGASEYLKVNTEYMKEFNQEANKFSFDNFESLTSTEDIDPSKMFEKVSVSDGMTTEMDEMAETLTKIAGLIAGIGTYVIIKKLLDGTIETKIAKLGEVFTSGGWVKFAGIAGVITGIMSAIEGVIELVRSDGKSVTGWFKTILGLVAAIAGVVALIKGKTLAGMIAGGIAIAGVVGLIITNAVSDANKADIPQYANGGLVDSGSLFIAGEAGAELVTTMPSGQTGVTNVAQFKQAMVEAIYECADVFQNDNGEVVLKLDGAEIARSKRFKSELNRTNAGLHLI